MRSFNGKAPYSYGRASDVDPDVRIVSPYDGLDETDALTATDEYPAIVDGTSYTANTVKFDIRFNEIVTGLSTNDIDLTGGTAAGVVVDDLSGSGERYVANVSWTSELGSVVLGVKTTAMLDLAGLANAEVAPAYYVIPIFGDVFSDKMDSGSNDWISNSLFLSVSMPITLYCFDAM